MKQGKGRSRQKNYTTKQVKSFIRHEKYEKERKKELKDRVQREEARKRGMMQANNEFHAVMTKLKVRYWSKKESLNNYFANMYLNGYRK